MISQHSFLSHVFAWFLALSIVSAVQADVSDIKVKIAEDIPFVEVNHQGVKVKITRIQDTENKLIDDFSKTSRPCPPFCIHPIEAAPGVRTIGEIELLEFLRTKVASGDGLLIDARMPDWYQSETIPGAVNIPFIIFNKRPGKRNRILELLGAVKLKSGQYDFSNVKYLSLFCNGPWCDQSPRAIKGLLKVGYPPEKLAYYRGGMQLWKLFGLTTVLPKSHAVE
ncbi:MAG TPA: rhodanese-like domain-containing protein [Crenotrichaceae bacterium]|nr:rhodanese-like domain-containing protein [Crenotrichaceae bacterium]